MRDDLLQYVDPIYEYKANIKDLYRYIAWAEDYNQSEENYWMTDTEYMEMIEAEWIDPSDSTDLFDDVNYFEELIDAWN